MGLFLGYDPGGGDKHGVAAVEIRPDGAFNEPNTNCLGNVEKVLEWLAERHTEAPAAIGIDTLLTWSTVGRPGNSGRVCDRALRARYPESANKVVAQNSLFSSMTINGIIVAKRAVALGLPVIESHPTLTMATVAREPHSTYSAEQLWCWFDKQSPPGRKKRNRKTDHMADAVVAAWCASRHHYGHWITNLHDLDAPGDVHNPITSSTARVRYPWPQQPVSSDRCEELRRQHRGQ